MYYLYIIQSIGSSRHYIGITDDLSKRLAKHNSASVKSTKAYRPWRMVYHEDFDNKTSARKREIYLKKTNKAQEELFKNIAAIV